MKANELRSKNVNELQNELLACLREQFNLRMQLGSRQIARADGLKTLRRNIARIKTIMGEKKREGNQV